MRVGSEASRVRPGSWVRGGSGLPGALPMEMAPDRPGLPPRPPSSAVSAGLPGLAGLRVTSDADSQDERGWSWGRKANGDEGAQLPNPGQRRRTASFVIPPPGGEGFKPGLAAGREGEVLSLVLWSLGPLDKRKPPGRNKGRLAGPYIPGLELRKEYVLIFQRIFFFLTLKRL